MGSKRLITTKFKAKKRKAKANDYKKNCAEKKQD